MKKVFKTIMAAAAALAISISGMCMVSADTQTATTKEYTGNDATGEIKTDDITFFLTVNDIYKASVEFGDFVFEYDMKTKKWSEKSFDGFNNYFKVTNNSSCDMQCALTFVINDDPKEQMKDIGFRLTNENENGSSLSESGKVYCQPADNAIAVPATYGEKLLSNNGSIVTYLTVENPTPNIGQLDNFTAGSITIYLSPAP